MSNIVTKTFNFLLSDLIADFNFYMSLLERSIAIKKSFCGIYEDNATQNCTLKIMYRILCKTEVDPIKLNFSTTKYE